MIRHLPLLSIIVFTILRLIIAWRTIPFLSADMNNFLIPWYYTIQNYGGIRALAEQVGNYGILYQFLISIGSYLPLSSVSFYKLLSLGFDFLIGACGGLIVWEIEKNNDKAMAKVAVVYCVIIMSPIVQMNSSVWGQCDSIYSFFAILSLYLLWKEKFLVSFISLGIAFAFKLQTIFFIPAFIIWYIKTRKYSILYFLVIPITMVATNIPGILMGRELSDVFTVFFEQVDTYHWVYSISGVLGAVICEDNTHYSIVAPILCSICILFQFIVLTLEMGDTREINFRHLIEISFLSTFGCYILLPAMHERYGYPAEIIGLIIAVTNKKTVPLLVPMLCITTLTYGSFLFGLAIENYSLLGIINTMILILYTISFFSHTPERNLLRTQSLIEKSNNKSA